MSAASLGGLAAAVAAGAVVSIVLVHGFGGGNTGGAVSSHAPTPTPRPAGVAACTAGDFAWSSDPWGGAAGSRGTIILARAVASLDRCQLKGVATLVLLDANGKVLVSGKTSASMITVTGGMAFQVGVRWHNWCGAEPSQPITLRLTLPGDSNAVPLVPANDHGLTFNTCNGPAPTSLDGTDFQPSDRAPQG